MTVDMVYKTAYSQVLAYVKMSHTFCPTGSDRWTPLEKRLFCKALLTHEKDFQLIHSEVRDYH